MIWKISDELKLNSKEEEIFASVFKKLNQRKNELNRSMQETIAKSGPESEKETVLRLQVYLKQIQDYNKLSEEEFDELKKIFSPSRMIQYFKIKQDLSTRLKLILSQGEGEKKSNRKLPPPQIIEEK